MRGSRVSMPCFFSTGRIARSAAQSARAIPCWTAPAWPDMPPQLRLAQRAVLQHPRDRMTKRERWVPLDHAAVSPLAQAPRISGVRRVDLVRVLLASHPNALDVDHDDVIAGVQVGRVDRLVFAA